MWRTFTTSLVAGDDIVFELEDNVMILDFVIKVTTAATGTALAGVLQCANTAGDVALHASIDLDAGTSEQVYDRSTALGTITDHNGTAIQFALTATAITVGATITMGLLVARIDYDADA
jgi:hypothetical protein